MKHLQPRLRADAIIQLAAAKEISDYFGASFGDPNRKLNARNKYRSFEARGTRL